MSSNQSTSDKLLLAAIELMADKGYDSTSTKEIAAAAGVNEVTLFRHFGTKQKLLEAAFHRFHYADEMTKLFSEGLTYELHDDLLAISRAYHRIMNRNRRLIHIALKGGGNLPETIREEARRHPGQLKQLLTRYLTVMAEQHKVLPSERHEQQALSFMWMNYGAFVTGLNAHEEQPEEALQAFIEESVRIFARALTP
jgi:TetR/AcrR family transcriptional regulator, mexJK operon transcriptional repressor